MKKNKILTLSFIASNLIFGTILFANDNSGFNNTPAVHNMTDEITENATEDVSNNYEYRVEEKDVNQIKSKPLVVNGEVEEPINEGVVKEFTAHKKIDSSNVSDNNKDILELLEIANQKKLEYDEQRQRIADERLKQDKDYIIKEKILEIQQIKAEMDLKKMKMDYETLDRSATREAEANNIERDKLIVEAELQLAILKDKYASISDDVTIIGKYGYYKFGDMEVYQIPTINLLKAQEKLKELDNMKNTLTESIVYYTKLLDNDKIEVEVLKNNIRMKKVDMIPEEKLLLNPMMDEKLEVTEGFVFNDIIITKVTKNSFTAKILE